MTTQNDCSRHSWLSAPGEESGRACQHCAEEAETARVLEGYPTAVAKFRVEGEVSTAVLLTSHATSCGGNEQLAIERHRDFFTAHLGGLRLEKVDKLPRTYTAEDVRQAFIAGYMTDRGMEDVERADVARRDAERANRAASAYVAGL